MYVEGRCDTFLQLSISSDGLDPQEARSLKILPSVELAVFKPR